MKHQVPALCDVSSTMELVGEDLAPQEMVQQARRPAHTEGGPRGP